MLCFCNIFRDFVITIYYNMDYFSDALKLYELSNNEEGRKKCAHKFLEKALSNLRIGRGWDFNTAVNIFKETGMTDEEINQLISEKQTLAA